MIRSGRLCWVVAMVLWATTAWGAASVRVMLLPFDIRARQDMAYLSGEIPETIQSQLSGEGADIIPAPAAITPVKVARLFNKADAIRGLAAGTNANYVVWGRLVFSEKNFEITAMLAETTGTGPPERFRTSGEGIEALSGAVRALAAKMAKRLFQQVRIAQIRIAGNQRIESDAIMARIKSKPGDIFSPNNLSADLKSIYAMGYFGDIRVESMDSPKGKIVTFEVKEKPTVKSISFTGNLVIKSKKLRENLDIRPGSILNIRDVEKNIERIEVAYKEKKYYNAKVTYKTRPEKNNEVALIFVIHEGKKVLIRKITFVGNHAYSSKRLKKLMKTSVKGFFSWITSSGEYNEAVLNQDLANLTTFYHNHGYVRARFAEPVVTQKGNKIFITLKVHEGERYRVGKVGVAGDLILPRKELLSHIKLNREKYFNQDAMRQDMQALTDLYSNYGYAYADATPDVHEDRKKRVVDVTYDLQKGHQVYFDKIIIAGNTKTRDKVIRRELDVQEQGLYSGARLKRSIRNLYRLNYFKDVKVDTIKGNEPDSMILKIHVKEKPTGSISFGGGYSSVENLFVTAAIAQENFLGLGDSLTLRAQLGGTDTQVLLNFTNPWLFDIPLSLGVNGYKWTREYDYYSRDSLGGGVTLGYPVFTDTRLWGGYSFDVGKITDLQNQAPVDIKELAGTFVTSAVSTGLTYDTRDRILNPTIGWNDNLSLEYAGIGGDIGFTKIIGEVGYYHPLFWGLVGHIHFKTGVVNQNSNMTLPDYEKFYLGGINSLRGFAWRDVHLWSEPVDDDNNPNTPPVRVAIGGGAMVLANLECIFPIAKSAGILGVVFFDTGNVFNNFSDIRLNDLRRTAGLGIRWNSPMGPIRVAYGFVLDPKPEDSGRGRFEFTMGTAF